MTKKKIDERNTGGYKLRETQSRRNRVVQSQSSPILNLNSKRKSLPNEETNSELNEQNEANNMSAISSAVTDATESETEVVLVSDEDNGEDIDEDIDYKILKI